MEATNPPKRVLRWLVLGTGAALALIFVGALLVMSGTPAHRALAQEPEVGSLATVDEAFTYQGRLSYSSVPVSGTCSLTFKLCYTASGPGGQIGIHDTHSSVPVDSGYFSVDVNDSGEFGSSAFIGEARWLEITVDSCTDGGGPVTLSPRVPLKAVPYAHTLRPGAEVEGNLDSDYLLAMENDGQGGGIFARSNSTTNDYTAGSFVADGSSGRTQAIFASNDSTTDEAAAGYFLSAGTTGETNAVYAQNDSGSDGAAAGHFYAPDTAGKTYAVYAQNDSTGDEAAAGYFYAPGSSESRSYAVYAQNDSDHANSAAGKFVSTATTGTGYGIVVESNSPGISSAGYFEAFASSGVTDGVFAGNRSNTDRSSAGRFYHRAEHGAVFGVHGQVESNRNGAAAGRFEVCTEGSGWGFGGDGSHGVFAVHCGGGDGNTAGYFYNADGNDKVYGVRAETASSHDNAYAVYADKTSCSGPDSAYCYAIYTDDKIHAAAFDTTASDVAEYYPTGQQLSPGDVVMAHPGGGGRVIRAEGGYNKTVLGVVSSTPGVSLGNDRIEDGNGNAGKVPITLIGRVPCRVSAESGPIRPGDLLTTSSTPGYAMRCDGVEQCFGSTIGKALDELDSGTGVIEILVMLQ